MSYVGLGQDCPGMEVYDPFYGACMCPPPLVSTGIVGECVSSETVVSGWGVRCPVDEPIPDGVSCNCPEHTVYTSDKRCTPLDQITGPAPPSPGGPGKLQPPVPAPAASPTKAAVAPVVLLVSLAIGVAFLVGAS